MKVSCQLTTLIFTFTWSAERIFIGEGTHEDEYTPERCLRQDELNDLLLLVQQSWLAWLQWELMLEVVQLVYLKATDELNYIYCC